MHRKPIIILGALVVVILGVWWWYTPTSTIKNLTGPGTAIVAFGDSLVEGVGAPAGADFVSELSRRINRPIINMGVRGNTTADARARIPDVLAQNPRVVLILLGGNDYLQGVPNERVFSTLGEIIQTIQDAGSAVLLLGVRGGIMRDSFAEDFALLARTYETGFVPDVLDGLLGRSAYMADAVHPNAAGYLRIADKVEPVLRQMLPR